MDETRARTLVNEAWDGSIVPELIEYIRIPNVSPHFDAKWAEHGHMDRAVAHIERWCREQQIPGLSVEVVRLPGRTPLIYMEVPGEGDQTVLLYGHLDKQPEMTGWDEGLGPWTPVVKDGRLFGRGGADDGYAAYASLTALRVLKDQGLPHARCVVMIEACEESGSFDLPFYVDALAERIGQPSLVVCLDSGCMNYDQLWATTSLRGNITGSLRVEVLREGVHSGSASGIVASSFRILRQVLDRLEDAVTGEIIPRELHVEIPPERVEQARGLAEAIGAEALAAQFPFVQGMRPMTDDPVELVLAGTWRPTLSVIGMDGIPSVADGGNVLRPFTTAKLSLRTPPTLDANKASAFLKELLEKDPPYGAKVTFSPDDAASGWDAPPMVAWLGESVDLASRACFGATAVYMGMGGTIPFMGMLGEKFPAAQFLITGVLGPGSNAHGPNEFLDISTGKKLTAAVAQVIADHYAATQA